MAGGESWQILLMTDGYRGRLAPSPTGWLHLGHARTFWTAYQRCLQHNGVLVMRNEDLDTSRARPEFAQAMLEDLRWLGIDWHEGPDCGGPFAPYEQSRRVAFYRHSFDTLRERGFVYPCTCSRQDVLRSIAAPHAGDDEPVYTGTCRNNTLDEAKARNKPFCWRFKVPGGENISFEDSGAGRQTCVAGRDFGDFVVWRQDGLPSYQLAVVTDDAAMQITEVVRGEDLLRSTARQILIYRALGWTIPAFHHCPLLRDEKGERLAKRHDSLSLRSLRAQGVTPAQIIESFCSLVPVFPFVK